MNCPYCSEYQNDNLNSLRIHAQKSHKVSSKQLHLDLFCDGVEPTCKCGCGEIPNFKSLQKGYCDFLQGHHVRETNGFWTEEGLEKSAETRREQFENGEREPWNKGETGLQDAWNKGLTKETDERVKSISESLMGHEVSEETRRKLSETNSNVWTEEMKQAASKRAVQRFKSGVFGHSTSNLEKTFENGFLSEIDVEYEKQKVYEGLIYDFYIPSKNIYIEVHGDFWHCNPEYYDEPQYECQEHNVKRDKRKSKIIREDDEKTLLVFWENDIKNNSKKVMKELIRHV